MTGIIFKALSGFYYVEAAEGVTVECRPRGKFRKLHISPLVGDRVEFSMSGEKGVIEEILPRKNCFVRPAVANIEQLIILAANVNPVTDPYLIDRITAIAAHNRADSVICVNKCDMDRGDRLYDIYSAAGFQTIRTSAVTGEGLDELRAVMSGRVSAFTGNSGVGKSSILNCLEPSFSIKTGEVSDKLGRGRHTTRHVELYRLSDGSVVMDTPGFSAFDTDYAEHIAKEDLQVCFTDFVPYIGDCQYRNCAHIKERGCAVLAALENGDIVRSRYDSYLRLYDTAKQVKDWELKPKSEK